MIPQPLKGKKFKVYESERFFAGDVKLAVEWLKEELKRFSKEQVVFRTKFVYDIIDDAFEDVMK